MVSGLSLYHLIVQSNFNLLYYSHLITFPTQLCQDLYSLAYYMINSFISVSTRPTLDILLHIINIYFDIISPYIIILCWFSFSLEVSLS